MSEFQKVANVADIPDPGKELVEIDDQLVVLFHVDGKFSCLDDVCTHDGGTLGDGELEGTSIACPRHGAKFDICTGAALTMPATQPTVAHEVKVEDGAVFVKLNDGEASETCSAAPTAAGEVSEDSVREALKQVIDPELFVNIVDLGLIYVVDLEPSEAGPTNVKVEMTMTSPMCPAGPQLVAQTKQVVEAMEQTGECEVKVVMDPPWTPDRMTDDARDHLGIF